MLVGLLGIMKAGAAYVPLDPAYPAERLSFMVEDAQLQCILTQTSLTGILPGSRARLLCIDQSIDSPGTPCLNSSTKNESQLAYVIYTSGSTGKPKGVQVTHRSVVNLLYSAAKTIGLRPEDNLLAVTTLSFDIAGLELFMPLIFGASITLATREEAGDGTRLAGLMEASNATVMQATPATWRLLIESGWKGSESLTGICGGEALKRSLADELLGRVKAVWNFYGPTETTIWSTAWRVAAGDADFDRPPTCQHPNLHSR